MEHKTNQMCNPRIIVVIVDVTIAVTALILVAFSYGHIFDP